MLARETAADGRPSLHRMNDRCLWVCVQALGAAASRIRSSMVMGRD
jgi:hypothetical protein